jgi:hypothetical protein
MFGSRDAVELREAVNVQERDIAARYCICALGTAGRCRETEYAMCVHYARFAYSKLKHVILTGLRRSQMYAQHRQCETKKDKKLNET